MDQPGPKEGGGDAEECIEKAERNQPRTQAHRESVLNPLYVCSSVSFNIHSGFGGCKGRQITGARGLAELKCPTPGKEGPHGA